MNLESRVLHILDLAGRSQPLKPSNIDRFDEYTSWQVHSNILGGGGGASERGGDMRAVFIKNGPKDVKAVQQMSRDLGLKGVIAFNTQKNGYGMLLKTDQKNKVYSLSSESACTALQTIFEQVDFGTTSIKAEIAIEEIMDLTSVASLDFINRGVFSRHYLETRLLAKLEQTVDKKTDALKPHIGNTKKMLKDLGWSPDSSKNTDSGRVCIITTEEPDLGIARKSGSVSPSYAAVTKLSEHAWVILTNGKTWRLYTDKAAASTTTYFEITLEDNPKNTRKMLYLVGIFGSDSYNGTEPLIIRAYNESQKYARTLEDNLADQILRGDIFLNIVKGLLDHNMTVKYSDGDLNRATENAFKVLYRLLFVLYAEARGIMPVRDQSYRGISLDILRDRLHDLQSDADGEGCWDHLKRLFTAISEGDQEYNLPQYNSELFEHDGRIDAASIHVQNKFIVPALIGLLEQDGESTDYAILEVRHIGGIYEKLLEFSVSQADADIAVHEDSKGTHIIKTNVRPTYKKNDLFLMSKEGPAGRKTTASYYTPHDIVQFLVHQGLKDGFSRREKDLSVAMKKYRAHSTTDDALQKTCIDYLVDIQVLDPTMGSGHFLVEALNQITVWAAGMLTKYPDHPLWNVIHQDRNDILEDQTKRGVHIDVSLLTDVTLLKRRIMKKCIFGVDVNPLAVELAKLSLWLDSFAVAMPLAHLEHHIKHGDSTIGMWLEASRYRDSTLDGLDDEFKLAKHIEKVSASPDTTVVQVRQSQNESKTYADKSQPYKNKYDVMAAQIMDKNTTLKQASITAHRVTQHWGSKSKDISSIVKSTKQIRDTHFFFHWELEFMDAFTNGRDGFDLITGNPPWAKTKPEDRDFFSAFDLEFYSLKKQDQIKRRKKILKNSSDIHKRYEDYIQKKAEQSQFYSKVYEQQGVGDKDLWQLVLERSFVMCVRKTGVISMLVPATLLTNKGSIPMRKHLLDKNQLMSLYVFENKGIFPIHDSHRFVAITARNGGKTTSSFPVAFFLHNPASLKDNTLEADKFGVMKAQDIRNSTPDQYIMPEIANALHVGIYLKLHRFGQTLGSGHEGWDVDKSKGFDTTNDSGLFSSRRRPSSTNWPVIKGENIHQFMHDFRPPHERVNQFDGLKRASKTRAYANHARDVFDMFRLAFRNQASDTNARTVIAAIIPPHTFIKNSMSTLILSKDGQRVFDSRIELESYHKKISYLAGIMNSMTFDFVTRAKTMTNPVTSIYAIPLPDTSKHDVKIAHLASRLSVDGTSVFRPFAKSMNVDNTRLSPSQRIKTSAHLDALVARAYCLSAVEYCSVLDSFKFGEDPSMMHKDSIDWTASRARPMVQFFGEVRKLAMEYFEEIDAN